MFKHLKSAALLGLVLVLGTGAAPASANVYGDRAAAHLGRHHGAVVMYHHGGWGRDHARPVPLRRLIRAARFGRVVCYRRPVRFWRHHGWRRHGGQIPAHALARHVRWHGGATIHCYRIH